MKLKTVFAASLLVGGVAFAEDITTGYTVGVLPLTLTAKETVICVPWIESGNASGGVAVSNLVKTAGLTRRSSPSASGDMLYWYDTSKGAYSSWYIDETSGEWTEEGGGNSVLPSAAALKRGDAVILQLASDTGLPKTVYIVGQVGTGAATTTIAAGTVANPTYTLLAPPFVAKLDDDDDDGKIDLNNSSVEWNTPSVDDLIITGIDKISTATAGTLYYPKTLSWNATESKWGTYVGKDFTSTALIDVGAGFWYKRASNSDMTVTWRAQ